MCQNHNLDVYPQFYLEVLEICEEFMQASNERYGILKHGGLIGYLLC